MGIVLKKDVTFPALRTDLFDVPTWEKVLPHVRAQHRPRFLMLYGKLRERSYSRLLTFEAARLLEAMGGELKIFDPAGLPLADAAPESHPKVQELRTLAEWSEGMVWCSPERHGAMTGIPKKQIDWILLAIGAVRPTQGKTLAVMEVSGGSQSFTLGCSEMDLSRPPCLREERYRECNKATSAHISSCERRLRSFGIK